MLNMDNNSPSQTSQVGGDNAQQASPEKLSITKDNPFGDPVVDTWNKDPEYKALPQDKKDEILKNYAASKVNPGEIKKTVGDIANTLNSWNSDPEFKKLSRDNKKQILSNFFDSQTASSNLKYLDPEKRSNLEKALSSPIIGAPETGPFYKEYWKGLKAGVTSTVPETVGQAGEALHIPGSATLVKYGEKNDTYQGDQSAWYQGATNAVGSFAPALALGALGRAAMFLPIPGARVVGGGLQLASWLAAPAVYGLSQYETDVQKAKARGLTSPLDTTVAPAINGLIEFGGDVLIEKTLEPFLGPLAKSSANVAESSAKSFLKTTVAKAAKTLVFKTLPVDTISEMGQNYGEALVEKLSGIDPDAKPVKEAIDVIAPTLVMSLTGGLAAHGIGRGLAFHALNTLKNPEADPKRRQKAASIVASAISEAEDDKAKPMTRLWLKYANNKINKKAPIDINIPTGKLKSNLIKNTVQYYANGPQTPEETNRFQSVMAEAYKDRLINDDDLNRVAKENPDLKDHIENIRRIAKKSIVRDNLESIITEGLTKGTFKGQPFNEDNAVALIKGGLENGIFSEDDVAAFKQKIPSIKSKLNEILAMRAANKINEHLALTGQGFDLVETPQGEEKGNAGPLALTSEREGQLALPPGSEGLGGGTPALSQDETPKALIHDKSGRLVESKPETIRIPGWFMKAGQNPKSPPIVEYKPILRHTVKGDIPWKTQDGAENALKSPKLNDKGITPATHKVVEAPGGGYQIVRIHQPGVSVDFLQKGKGQTLISWIRSKGGVKDKTLPGEVRALTGKESGVVALTNSAPDKGIPFDEMASMAADEGWIPKTGDKVNAFKELLSKDIDAIKNNKPGERARPLAEQSEISNQEQINKENEQAKREEQEYYKNHPDEGTFEDLNKQQDEAVSEIGRQEGDESARKAKEDIKSEVENETPGLEKAKKDEGFPEDWDEGDIQEKLDEWRAELDKETKQPNDSIDVLTGVGEGQAQTPPEVSTPGAGQAVKSAPAISAIPEFGNTEEAIAFGKQATEEQIHALRIKREEISRKINDLKTAGKFNEATKLAGQAGFMREAIQASKGKIPETPKKEAEKPAPQPEVPKGEKGKPGKDIIARATLDGKPYEYRVARIHDENAPQMTHEIQMRPVGGTDQDWESIGLGKAISKEAILRRWAENYNNVKDFQKAEILDPTLQKYVDEETKAEKARGKEAKKAKQKKETERKEQQDRQKRRRAFLDSVEKTKIKGKIENISVTLTNGSWEQRRARVYGDYAVTKGKDGYSVTHTPSGIAVFQGLKKPGEANIRAKAFSKYVKIPADTKSPEASEGKKKGQELFNFFKNNDSDVPEFINEKKAEESGKPTATVTPGAEKPAAEKKPWDIPKKEFLENPPAKVDIQIPAINNRTYEYTYKEHVKGVEGPRYVGGPKKSPVVLTPEEAHKFILQSAYGRYEAIPPEVLKDYLEDNENKDWAREALDIWRVENDKDYAIPEFKSNDEAVKFGKTATPEQIKALKIKRNKIEIELEKLRDEKYKDPVDLNNLGKEKKSGEYEKKVDEHRRFVKALEAAEGKLDEETHPQVRQLTNSAGKDINVRTGDHVKINNGMSGTVEGFEKGIVRIKPDPISEAERTGKAKRPIETVNDSNVFDIIEPIPGSLGNALPVSGAFGGTTRAGEEGAKVVKTAQAYGKKRQADAIEKLKTLSAKDLESMSDDDLDSLLQDVTLGPGNFVNRNWTKKDFVETLLKEKSKVVDPVEYLLNSEEKAGMDYEEKVLMIGKDEKVKMDAADMLRTLKKEFDNYEKLLGCLTI